MYTGLRIPGVVTGGQYIRRNPVSPRQAIPEQTVAHCNTRRSADSAAMLNEPLSVEPVPKSDYMRGAGLDLFLV